MKVQLVPSLVVAAAFAVFPVVTVVSKPAPRLQHLQSPELWRWSSRKSFPTSEMVPTMLEQGASSNELETMPSTTRWRIFGAHRTYF